MHNFVSPENTKLFHLKSLNTIDRSCEVEIGKSSEREENLVELRVRAAITELFQRDPYEVCTGTASDCAGVEEKCEVLSRYFENIRKLRDYEKDTVNEVQEKPPVLSNKRKILLKFLDNRQEDEILNKDITEIPSKLREEIESCKQVLKKLLTKSDMPGQKLMNYLEILYECGLLKLHSDPICLFIHETEVKGVFEDVIRLTCLSNTYKTFLLRSFLALESNSFETLEQIKTELFNAGLLVDYLG